LTTLRAGEAADAAACARLHVERIHEGFLARLGPRFLTRLYRRIAVDPRSFLVVAADGERIAGFVAGTEDTGALYRSFLLHDGVVAAAGALPSLAREPGKVLETLRYGRRGAGDDLPPAELLSTAVDVHYTGRGIGSELVAVFTHALRERGVASARVVVGAGNDTAVAVYRKGGFEPVTVTEVHAGTASTVLVWRA
jgi:ribosomal protein S18 acetylase RimI-like enzyme